MGVSDCECTKQLHFRFSTEMSKLDRCGMVDLKCTFLDSGTGPIVLVPTKNKPCMPVEQIDIFHIKGSHVDLQVISCCLQLLWSCVTLPTCDYSCKYNLYNTVQGQNFLFLDLVLLYTFYRTNCLED